MLRTRCSQGLEGHCLCYWHLCAEKGVGFYLPSGEKQCTSLTMTDSIINHNYVSMIYHTMYCLCWTPWQQCQLSRGEEQGFDSYEIKQTASAMYHPKQWSFKFLFFVWTQKRIGVAVHGRQLLFFICWSPMDHYLPCTLAQQTNKQTNKVVFITFHFQNGFHFAVFFHLFFLSLARENKVWEEDGEKGQK